MSVRPEFAVLSDHEVPTDKCRVKLPNRWWQYLTPCEIAGICWLVLTTPLILVDVAGLWKSVAARVVLLPCLLLMRPVWTLWKAPRAGMPRLLFLAFSMAMRFFPLLLYPWGYTEVGNFIAATWKLTRANECVRDAAVQRVEEQWFHSQPSRDMHTKAGTGRSARVGMEYLQFCYFGLFILVTVVPLALYLLFRGRQWNGEYEQEGLVKLGHTVQRPPFASAGAGGAGGVAGGTGTGVEDAFTSESDLENPNDGNSRVVWWGGTMDPELEAAILCILLTSFTCWIFYLSYPVAGPLWCLQPQPQGTLGYFFARFNFQLQKAGAAHGTATPSSHCAASIAVWLVTLRYHKRLFVSLAALVPGLCFATVYLHYHYALDAIFGSLWGCCIPLLAFFFDREVRKKLKLKRFAVAYASHRLLRDASKQYRTFA